MTMPSGQLIHTASWRVVSELYRRFPGRFRVVQTHPGGGQYDCLSLYQEDERINLDHHTHVADFNRAGRFHVFQRFDGRKPGDPIEIWPLMVEANDMKVVLDQVTQAIGLAAPASMPASTPAALVYRFIAAVLTGAVFGKDGWDGENGCFDSSDGSTVREAAFQLFPSANERLKVSYENDFWDQPAYRFWFITRNREPVFCLETGGSLWTLDGKHYSLMDVYIENQRSMWQMAGAVAGRWMK